MEVDVPRMEKIMVVVTPEETRDKHDNTNIDAYCYTNLLSNHA
jgi:hypothetical protein